MTLKQKLLTLDIIVLLAIAIFALSMIETGNQEILIKYFIPIMLTAYFIGRYIPLQIVKKHLQKNQ
jgi:hypothetical protein